MRLGDQVGFSFFTLATVLSIMAGLSHPSILAWLSVFHNGMLTVIYLKRRQPAKTDNVGLVLGLIAAFLPITSYPDNLPDVFLIIGLVGYALLFWSLLVLWGSFGIAPADRGLVTKAPYSIIRHPMYLGELIMRTAMVAATGGLFGYTMLIGLVLIQILRIKREEAIIENYQKLIETTRWRMIPFVW